MPLSFFILGLAAIAVCFIAVLYLAYRNSRKLRDVISVVISPDENCSQDRSILSIIRTFLWFFIIHISITLIYHFADLLIYGETIENSIGNPSAIETEKGLYCFVSDNDGFFPVCICFFH